MAEPLPAPPRCDYTFARSPLFPRVRELQEGPGIKIKISLGCLQGLSSHESG